MPTPTLIDVLVRTAASAGCEEPTRLRHALEIASDNRQPLMDAVVDSTMVDEDRFFAELATGLGMPYAEEGIGEAAEGLRNNFPAKLALRHRICPLQVASGEATILTYNPFDLSHCSCKGGSTSFSTSFRLHPAFLCPQKPSNERKTP